MAEVFLARAKGEGNFTRTVVVKRMLPQLALEPSAVEMFLDEARLGSRLHHPNIVPVLDLGRIGDEYFMVLEHVDGADLGTLENRAKAAKIRIPPAHLAWIVARAADGLRAAHEARDPETGQPLAIVHRDVSASNILISRTGDVRVADFGVARSTAQQSHTINGGLKGKISYMSPEHLLGLPLDARSDIFSLGIVLWQLLTGRRRHESRNELAIMQATIQEPAPRPSSVAPDVNPTLETIVMKMLEREVDKRYQTMREIAHDLDRFAYSEGSFGHASFEAWLLENAKLFEPVDMQVRDVAIPVRRDPNLPTVSLPPPLWEQLTDVTDRVTPVAAGPGQVLPSGRPGTPVSTPSAPRMRRELRTPSPPPARAVVHRSTARAAAPAAPAAAASALRNWNDAAFRRVRRNPASRYTIVDGKAVVTCDRVRHTLNASATFIWELVDGQRTLEQIAVELPQAFIGLDLDIAREEVLAFVREAVRGGLLVLT